MFNKCHNLTTITHKHFPCFLLIFVLLHIYFHIFITLLSVLSFAFLLNTDDKHFCMFLTCHVSPFCLYFSDFSFLIIFCCFFSYYILKIQFVCFWLCLVLIAVPGLSIAAASRGYSQVAVCRLLVVASLVVEHRLYAHGLQQLWHVGLVALWHA